MGLFRYLRLFYECFKLAGLTGLKACFCFLSGTLVLDDLERKSSVFLVGDLDA